LKKFEYRNLRIFVNLKIDFNLWKFTINIRIKVNKINVKELDINAYLGNWYEVVSSPMVHLTFEKDAYCSRATYSLRNDGSLNVLNA